MRSEFLGRCSEFSGLAEAFNRSQYLVPRLTRDERREAIERPLRLFGITPAPALVQQVLNDAGDAPDQLPSLQHALLRTFREWQRVGDTPRLEPKYYEVVGGIERAIQNHGEEVLASLDSTGRQVVEKVFRALTVTQGGVSLRRPRTLETLYAVVGASTPEQRAAVDHVVAVFGERANSFLTTSTTRLTPQTVVDITHESLLRRWSRLREWMREESRSAEWYADATRDVARHARGEVGLWRDPELTGILKRRESEGWNDTWANQYRQESDPPFPEVMSFLAASHAREQERLHAEQELRDRELQQTRALAAAKRRQTVILALLLAGVAGAGLLAYRLVLKDRELARTSASIVNLSQQRDTANSRVGQLEQEKTDLEKRTSSSSATTADTAQLERLNAQIQAAKAEANARQDEIAKLRKDQELGSSDRGALLSRIDALQGQLTQASADRDKLKSQSDDYVQQLARQKTQLDEANREIARLKEIASSGTPVTGSPIVPDSINASSQDVVRAFTNGVRSYELGDWQKAADSMREAIRLQSAARQVPREARMSGTRYVPYAPQSYLGAALFELKSSCQLLNPVLAAANQETPPGDVRTKIQTARRQCGAQP
jgi:hypothetical protein